MALQDQIFVERGEVACHAASAPHVAQTFSANIFWMGNMHLEKGAKCFLKLTTQEIDCVVESVQKVINSSTLEEISKKAHEVAKNEVAEVIIRAKKPVAFDLFDEIPETGRFVLVVDHQVRGGGIILKKVEPFGSI